MEYKETALDACNDLPHLYFQLIGFLLLLLLFLSLPSHSGYSYDFHGTVGKSLTSNTFSSQQLIAWLLGAGQGLPLQMKIMRDSSALLVPCLTTLHSVPDGEDRRV
ncbi:hypothetical protein ACFX2F_012859 [Malus domestica]